MIVRCIDEDPEEDPVLLMLCGLVAVQVQVVLLPARFQPSRKHIGPVADGPEPGGDRIFAASVYTHTHRKHTQ